MSRNFINLDDLHKMFTDAGIDHHYTYGDLVITVFRGDHIWTVGETLIIYWGGNTDVSKTRSYEFTRTNAAYDYIMDAYSEAL